MASDSPSQLKVFETAELLENILLHTSLRDLFVLQRVCKCWNEAIVNSVKLCTAMFLRPTGNKIREAVYLMDTLKKTCRVCKVGFADRMDEKIYRGHTHNPEDDIQFNSYLKDLHPPMNSSSEMTADDCGAKISTACNDDYVINPFLKDIFGLNQAYHSCKDYLLDGLSFEDDDTSIYFYSDSEHGSWKNMYITQPPLTHMTVQSTERHDIETRANMIDGTLSWVKDGYATLMSTTRAGVTLEDLIVSIDGDRDYQHYCTPTLEQRGEEDYEGLEDDEFIKELTEEVEELRRVVSFRLHVPKSLEGSMPAFPSEAKSLHTNQSG